MLKDNLSKVQKRIQEAASRAGRDVSEITLVAVSKTRPAEDVSQIYECNIRDFGENKVQEILQKSAVLAEDINWHMIGHLQRNKVRDVLKKAMLIHSVDSVRLAEKISEEAVKSGINVDILLEINIAKEESKFGFLAEQAEEALCEIEKLPNIKVLGLMTSAPFTTDPESNRVYFRALKQLLIDLNAKNTHNTTMSYLSMGMTGDFEVAIEEGATHVRVGTAIFGEREYN